MRQLWGACPPKVFSWRTKGVVSIRIFYSGMGALQESLLFAFDGSELVHLREGGALLRSIQDQKITVHHRNGGFCDGSLVWQNWAGRDDAEARSGATALRATYVIQGNRLVLESAALTPNEKGKTDCEAYPRE